ncbi:hypothetical protein CALVIDRAFT_566399 [Calocera viscosa TUFC12733]|uniref:Uncharacterized protein n=1 Tax=Calocera viscosa (strain TUFC12733) TaxID=1330018 RepID=A0A167JJT7_CALVF|nr:hypothetical protein CALVIDRAFT_566399 [Calocera viscosa TUFC12733]
MSNYSLIAWPGIVYLACFAMGCFIPVAMPLPLPAWVVSMFVSYGLDLTGAVLTALGRADKSFTLLGGMAWFVTAILMLIRRPNCNAGSDWFQSLIPYIPINGDDPEHTAYVKCVFSGFQLASGIAHLLSVGLVLCTLFCVGTVAVGHSGGGQPPTADIAPLQSVSVLNRTASSLEDGRDPILLTVLA